MREERAHRETHQDANQRQGEHAEVSLDAVAHGIDHPADAGADARVAAVHTPGRVVDATRATTVSPAARGRGSSRGARAHARATARGVVLEGARAAVHPVGVFPAPRRTAVAPEPGERADRRHVRVQTPSGAVRGVRLRSATSTGGRNSYPSFKVLGARDIFFRLLAHFTEFGLPSRFRARQKANMSKRNARECCLAKKTVARFDCITKTRYYS